MRRTQANDNGIDLLARWKLDSTVDSIYRRDKHIYDILLFPRVTVLGLWGLLTNWRRRAPGFKGLGIAWSLLDVCVCSIVARSACFWPYVHALMSYARRPDR